MMYVEDQAAQRRLAMNADAVAVGKYNKFLVPNDLQVVETHRDHRHHHGDERGEDGDSWLDTRDRARLLAAVVITPARHDQTPRAELRADKEAAQTLDQHCDEHQYGASLRPARGAMDSDFVCKQIG